MVVACILSVVMPTVPGPPIYVYIYICRSVHCTLRFHIDFLFSEDIYYIDSAIDIHSNNVAI